MLTRGESCWLLKRTFVFSSSRREMTRKWKLLYVTPGSKILLTIFLADKFVLLLMVGFVLRRRLVYLPTHTSDPYMVRFGMWERQAIVIASCKRINKSESKLSSFIKNGGKVDRAFSSSLGNIKRSLSIFEFKRSWYCYWDSLFSIGRLETPASFFYGRFTGEEWGIMKHFWLRCYL